MFRGQSCTSKHVFRGQSCSEPKHGPSPVSTPEAAAGVLCTALQGWFVYWMHSMPADTNLLIYLSCNGRFAWVCVCVCVCVYVFSMLGQVCMCRACTCTHVYDIQICTFQSCVVEIRADRYAFILTQLLQRPMRYFLYSCSSCHDNQFLQPSLYWFPW